MIEEKGSCLQQKGESMISWLKYKYLFGKKSRLQYLLKICLIFFKTIQPNMNLKFEIDLHVLVKIGTVGHSIDDK